MEFEAFFPKKWAGLLNISLPRYSSGLTIIREMGMIYITISDLEAKYGYIQSTLARIFDLCGPTKLWYSICVSFYYNDSREHIRVFHNGKSCLDKVFIDEFGDEPIRFRQNVTLGIDKPGFTGRHAYGKVADFNLWNRSLSSEEMKYFTSDCHKAKSNKGKNACTTKTLIETNRKTYFLTQHLES